MCEAVTSPFAQEAFNDTPSDTECGLDFEHIYQPGPMLGTSLGSCLNPLVSGTLGYFLKLEILGGSVVKHLAVTAHNVVASGRESALTMPIIVTSPSPRDHSTWINSSFAAAPGSSSIHDKVPNGLSPPSTPVPDTEERHLSPPSTSALDTKEPLNTSMPDTEERPLSPPYTSVPDTKEPLSTSALDTEERPLSSLSASVAHTKESPLCQSAAEFPIHLGTALFTSGTRNTCPYNECLLDWALIDLNAPRLPSAFFDTISNVRIPTLLLLLNYCC